MSTVKDSTTQGKTISIECPDCKCYTNHAVERALDWESDVDPHGPDIQYWATYQIVRCKGCDALSFRSVHSDSDECEYNQDGVAVALETECLYPERMSRSITSQLYLGDNVYQIPEIIQTIYRETLSAVQHDLPTLGGVGIRAVVEATCQDLKAKKWTLEKSIDELTNMSLLTPDGAKILHGIRLLGNDAAHQMKAPNRRQITAALRVIDHLLLGVYVLPKQAKVFPKPKPKAQKKPSKASSKKQTATEKS